MDGLQVRPVTTEFLLPRLRIIVVRWGLTERPPDRGNIDVEDLLGLRVVNGTEVQRKGILGIVDTGPVVHERLLQTHPISETLVIADRPCFTPVSDRWVSG